MMAFNAYAEEGKECRYEVKLWGKLRSGPNISAQDKLRVSVIGEMRSGESLWYSVVRSPGAEPELIPQIALEQPYPSGTCLSFTASLKDSFEEAWSDYTSDMIHEEDIEIPVPRSKAPVGPKPDIKETIEHNVAEVQDSQGIR